MKSSYEDLQENIRSLKTPAIEIWENKYADRKYTIHLEIPEFTCICPKTGLPDFALIKIDFVLFFICLIFIFIPGELHSLESFG